MPPPPRSGAARRSASASRMYVGVRPLARRCCSSVSWFHQMASPVPDRPRAAPRGSAIFAAASARPVDHLAAHDVDLPQVAACLPLAQAIDASSRIRSAPFWMSNASRMRVRVGEVLLRRDQLVLGAADDVREARGGVLDRAPWRGRRSARTAAAARAAAAAARPGRARPRLSARPTSARWSDRTRLPNEWKLWTHSRLAVSRPSVSSSRSSSSPAARTL